MTPEEKIRLDMLLVDKGLFPSREKARAAIMAGEVLVEGRRVEKAGTRVNREASIDIKSTSPAYVSRGGLKLEKALQDFNLDVEGKTLLDVGASTGGFSDCALKRGAARVFAVDVGYGQLAWSLRQDPRVKNLERLNIRHLTKEALAGAPIDLALVDVSFISLRLVFPVLKNLDVPRVLTLVKPQFEAGKGRVGRGGVVRDPETHRLVLERVFKEALLQGYHLQNLTYSPIKGPKGNIEYLALFGRSAPLKNPPIPEKIIAEAHERLQK